MTRSLKLGTSVLVAALLSGAAFAESYGPYPITEKSYSGDKTNSVAYTGQVARNIMIDSLKKLAGQADGGANAEELKDTMMLYFARGNKEDLAIVSHKGKDGFPITQTMLNEISSGANLVGKTYGGLVPGWPGNKTGAEVVEHMIHHAAMSEGGVSNDLGYDWGQLIQKFLIGAVSYNQAVDNYLDEKMTADNKPNNKPYSDGAAYTGKEHSWDEAFGYFGAPAHALDLSAGDAYGISKKTAFDAGDANGDGTIDLKSEMTFGNAYYAADADKSGTDYLQTITAAFIEGRKVITAADGEALSEAELAQVQAYAATIEDEMTRVLAEATFKYAGSVYGDIEKIRADKNNISDELYRDYIKHWGELKGFAMALQTGRENLGGTAVRLNRLIGYGPPTKDESVVTGIDADGNFVKDGKMSWNAYQLNMLKVQDLLIKEFGVEARKNDGTENLANLIKVLDSDSGGAETD
ncbi:MAG: DUF4856 domain-containing protein [Rhodobacteraceae bacterium]|nr:DUF4856 domain-containing protein [Paracoccaceae bacterium]